MQRNRLVIALVLGLVFASGCASVPKHLVGQPAPATRFTMLDGNQVALREFQGRPTVIAFWAMSCKQSPKTIERLNKYISSGRAKNAEFIAVSLDKSDEFHDLKEFLKYRNMDRFDHSFSGNEAWDEAYLSFQGQQIPLIVIVGADGKIAAMGSDTSVVEEYFG